MASCNYVIHVRGTRQNVFTFLATMKRFAELNIEREFGTDDCYTVWFSNKCYNSQSLYGKEVKYCRQINTALTEQDIREGKLSPTHFNISIGQKSELLGLDVMVESWSKEENFHEMSHYKNGYFINVVHEEYSKRKRIDFEF